MTACIADAEGVGFQTCRHEEIRRVVGRIHEMRRQLYDAIVVRAITHSCVDDFAARRSPVVVVVL